ncbi:MAG: MepB family protein [Flavobacteriaceae bacterium]|nr:MepB family protein [Flavobacteriaceae bacterium]
MEKTPLYKNSTIDLIATLTNTPLSEITGFHLEKESQKYHACNFQIKGIQFRCRQAFTSPKKVGQFVTFWKRNAQKQTAPYHESDAFDSLIIISKHQENCGYFKFPKSILIEKGVITSTHKAGKRGFRVYPPWSITNNKQARNSQQWQLNYFTKHQELV